MKTNRRYFIKQTGIATAGLGIASAIPFNSWAQTIPPGNKVNVAIIGCNSMGFGILKHHLSFPDVNCVAMCDIDDKVLNERSAEIQKTFNQKPKLYKDFRKMLEQKDIDAVIIGTPDHWHCLMTVYALQAGKHVYVEKPMANTIEECNIMVKAANYYKKTVQVGQQQRSGFIFQKSMELIKSGKIGKLRKVNIWANFNYGVGGDKIPDSEVPAGVDYDMWLGPAPKRAFNKNRFHGLWRMFWDYGGGLVSDWGVHLIDMGLWTKDLVKAPEKALVYAGNTYHQNKARETFDSLNASFPKEDFVINYDVIAGIQQGPYGMLYGIAFIGDDGTIVADRSKMTLNPEWDDKAKKSRTEEYKFDKGEESHKDHVRNFLDCIKSGNKNACPPEIGRAAALHVHIANIAGRVGEPALLWDDVNNRFTNSEAANNLIVPEYRSPWTLPKI
ncbi:MAG: Gfo/Idh/MocA family oxidoreductase [Bacteroidales bacterium]